jgi:membrane associated rhomboid family serine protease
MNRVRRPLPYHFYNATLGLVIACVVVYLLTLTSPRVVAYLGLFPQLVTQDGWVWQLVTYMFVHDPRSFWHILFNMLGLYMFGIPLEREMGSTEFLIYYFTTGIGVGIVSLLLGVSVIGASGAIYALLLGFATYFPHSRIFLFGLLPLQAPMAVLVFAAMSLFFQFTGLQGGVAHFAHLAGIVFGYLYFLLRLGINPARVFLER